MQNTQFGYKTLPSTRSPRTRQPQVQQPVYLDEQPEHDPKWDTVAYLKLRFTTKNATRSLKANGKDIPLRRGNKLESMLIDFWMSGRDLNDLKSILDLEIVDANPNDDDDEFDLNEELLEPVTPVQPKLKPKPRTQSKTRKPTSDEPLDDDHPY
jgi:hypothetical protein